jgi:uncharacterized protein
MKATLGAGIVGVALGFALSRIGFSRWDEVHRMFTFQDLRLLLTFMLAVVLLVPTWVLIRKLSTTPPRWLPRRIHPGTVAGGVLFGAGWALSGACPSIGLVQLGEGQLGALWTLGGVFLGNYLYSVVHPRYFRWTAGSCVDD